MSNFGELFNSEKITKQYFITLLVVTSISWITLFSIIYLGYKNQNSSHLEQTKQLLLSSCKTELATIVDMIINNIDYEIKKVDNFLDSQKPYLSEGELEVIEAVEYDALRRNIAKRFRSINLSNNNYIWIDEILNFDGGDKYAIRLVHTNRPETEGTFLSTRTQDVKGNYPYLEELEGIKKDGQIYSTYWLPKADNEEIGKKITFAKLYPKFNWLISTGAYLDENKLPTPNSNSLDNKLIILIVLIAAILITSLIVIVILTIKFRRKIINLTQYSESKIESYEEELVNYNKDLDRKLQARTAELKLSLEENIINETRYKDYVNNSPEGIFILDLDGKFKHVNQAGIELLGFSEFELLELTFGEVIHSESKEESIKAIEKLLSNGKISGTFSFIRKNKEKIFCRIESVVISDYDIFCFAIDVTSEYKYALELAEYRDKLEKMVEERTENIKETNQKLEENIKALERLNKIFVGRELRIKELRSKLEKYESPKDHISDATIS